MTPMILRISFIAALLRALPVFGQVSFSLSDVVLHAQMQSPKFKLAQTQNEVSYYQYQTYKSDFRPSINLYGNVPGYSKQYYGVRQPDGAILFQSIIQNNSNLGLGVSQKLPFTGGELSLNTELVRFDDFIANTKQYSSTPVYLKLTQPLFALNELRWKKKIEPLKLEESRKQYVQEMESLAEQAAQFYFAVLDAQSNMEIAGSNLKNTETNFEIEKKRIDLGTTTEDKLLQLELNMLQSKQYLEKAKYDYQIAQLNLRTFLGYKTNDEFSLVLPSAIPIFSVDLNDAFNYARSNRTEFISFERKRQEALRDAAQAKADKIQMNLAASYGVNNTAPYLSHVYKNPNNQQQLSLGFNIPIVDWGRRKARYNTALANSLLTETTNEFDETTIYQQITTLVKNIELLKSNITLARKTDSVAHRRFTIANKLFQSGKLSVTDLSVAQTEKDNARRNYIAALQQFWVSYYTLRRYTLYDFVNNANLYKEAGN